MDTYCPVSSACPFCRHRRTAFYTLQEVTKLLRTKRPVEVWCGNCEFSWPLTELEQTAVKIAARAWLRATRSGCPPGATLGWLNSVRGGARR